MASKVIKLSDAFNENLCLQSSKMLQIMLLGV